METTALLDDNYPLLHTARDFKPKVYELLPSVYPALHALLPNAL